MLNVVLIYIHTYIYAHIKIHIHQGYHYSQIFLKFFWGTIKFQYFLIIYISSYNVFYSYDGFLYNISLFMPSLISFDRGCQNLFENEPKKYIFLNFNSQPQGAGALDTNNDKETSFTINYTFKKKCTPSNIQINEGLRTFLRFLI